MELSSSYTAEYSDTVIVADCCFKFPKEVNNRVQSVIELSLCFIPKWRLHISLLWKMGELEYIRVIVVLQQLSIVLVNFELELCLFQK